MSRVAYVNGRFAPLRAPLIRVEDRGFQFSDGIYEVWAVADGRLVDEAGHFTRLDRSLRELAICPPASAAALRVAILETVRRNRVRHGLAYLQITRGSAPRDHAFPQPPPPPTLVITAKSIKPPPAGGVRVITAADIRWGRCDIKSVSLLANVLAREQARQAGAHEAWLVDADGFITEGAASNAWIVTAEGRVVTRPLGPEILPGVTRARLMEIAAALQIKVEERAFSLAEAKAAREAFLTSATRGATAVIAIDDALIGDGRPGPITQRLRAAYAGADVH